MSFSTESEIKPSAPPVSPLFRQQAITHISTKQYGTVILAKSFSYRFLTTFFVLIAFGIIAFFMFFSTTRKAQTSGVLLPDTGVIRVMSNQSGFVTEKRVSEGQVVKAGDVLFVLQNKQNTEHNIVHTEGKEGLDEQVNGMAKNQIVDTQETISALLQKRRDSFTAELKQANVQTQQRLAALQNLIIQGLTPLILFTMFS